MKFVKELVTAGTHIPAAALYLRPVPAHAVYGAGHPSGPDLRALHRL